MIREVPLGLTQPPCRKRARQKKSNCQLVSGTTPNAHCARQDDSLGRFPIHPGDESRSVRGFDMDREQSVEMNFL